MSDDLSSTSGKMKKAAKAGIPVKLYESTLENKLVKSVENAVNEAINELF